VALSLGARKGKAFVNVHLHCIAGNLKKISKMSMLPLSEKISADDHDCYKYILFQMLYNLEENRWQIKFKDWENFIS